jgi:diaminopimelate epimerase
MSGNGIRCLVAACLRAGAGTSPLAVVTDAGERIVTLELNGDRGFGEVAMGDAVVREGPAGTLGVVDVGNPHVVVRDNAGDDERTREESARGLSDAVGGANVEFVDVVSRDRVRLSVYERGAGWTLACGTGSVAVVAALRARGEVDDRVTVANPGGDLVVTADSSGYQLAGPVKFVADVEWSAA